MTVEETIIRNLGRLLTYEQLKEQALAVLVYGTCPSALNLTPQQEAEMKVLIGKYMRQHLRLNQDLATVFTHLQRNGLHPVLLKGQGCASYYPNPTLRATGDLDIWIGEKDIDKAIESIYTLPNTSPDGESRKHYNIKYDKTHIELHRFAEELPLPSKNRYLADECVKQMNHSRNIVLGGISFDIPSAQFFSLHIFLHLWGHFCSRGIGLRQFVDLAFVLHQDRTFIDEQALKKTLKKIDKLQAWQTVGCFLVNVLKLPKEEFPLYTEKYKSNSTALLNVILKEGNFGQKLSIQYAETNNYWLKKLGSLKNWAKRLSNIDLYKIYPPLIGESLVSFIFKVFNAIKK